MSVAISMTVKEQQALAILIKIQRSALDEAEGGNPREEVVFTIEDLEIVEGFLQRVQGAGEISPS